MQPTNSRFARLALALGVAALAAAALTAPASAKTKYMSVKWMKGFAAPNTPKKLDKVGVIEIGSHKAKNVLVLEPGTSAAAPYFVPLAEWIVEKAPEWQVWAVQRRENLLQEERGAEVQGRQGQRDGILQLLPRLPGGRGSEEAQRTCGGEEAKEDGGKEWGMNVAVEDLHIVIEDAKKMKGKVVLGGHSLGGSVVTAYATWDFAGQPGADGLSGSCTSTAARARRRSARKKRKPN